MHETPAPVRTYNTTELAALYNVSLQTMREWISRITDLGPRIGYIYSIKQVQTIFNHLGTPYVKSK